MRIPMPLTGAVLAVIGLIAGCVPRAENEVVLYSAADREYSMPILSAFERRNPEIKIATQFDVESTKTVGLVTRIESERDRVRCDLFWNNEIMHTLRLESLGQLDEVQWDLPSDWPVNMRGSSGTWVGFAARARILVVNRKLLPNKADWPDSVMDLADEKWKGRCGVALPLFGTTATHFAVLNAHLGEAKAEEFFRKVKGNAVVLSGNKQVAQAVSTGQLSFGLTDTDDALVEIDNGLNIGIVYPDQQSEQMGTLLIPNTLCVLKSAPHPLAARRLGNYLLSEDIEGRLAMGPSGQFPIRPNHPEKSRAQTAERVRWMLADFRKASEQWASTTEKIRDIFRGTPGS